MIWLIALALLLLAFAGAPFFALIAAVALLGLNASDYDLIIAAAEFFRITDVPVLIAIPLFTIAGYLLGESKAPQRLVRLTDALFGWMPGGLAVVALMSCALFTAFTGATGVTIVALGAVLFPALIQARYPTKFTLGLITTSGSLGLLFAPSLPLIIYAVVAQQLNTTPPVGVDEMFRAGLLPGLMMLVLLAIYSVWSGGGRARARVKFSGREALAAAWDARWEIPLPVVVVGGIYGGWFAPSEAAAVTALYVSITVLAIRREISLSKVPQVCRDAMVLVGAILVILGCALALTNYLIDADIPGQLFEVIREHISSRFVFLLVLIVFLLFFGMLLEGYPAIIILVPIVLPIAMRYGVDPVHFGIMFLAILQLGFFTPPLGMNLFISSYRFNRPVLEVVRACVPFFFIVLFCVLVITFWPWLSLVLVR
jgi:tripartite ATP-independent transporter DctM subunit